MGPTLRTEYCVAEHFHFLPHSVTRKRLSLGRSTGRGVHGYGYGLPHCAPGTQTRTDPDPCTYFPTGTLRHSAHASTAHAAQDNAGQVCIHVCIYLHSRTQANLLIYTYRCKYHRCSERQRQHEVRSHLVVHTHSPTNSHDDNDNGPPPP